ncbi:hypothetical protein CGRA01v4_01918 [Colletotrichum graminicola]|nr:hypothetical protein CGRA01v4_01918 [Colletotrichum graminicola]
MRVCPQGSKHPTRHALKRVALGGGQQNHQPQGGLWVALPSCIPKTRAVQASDRERLSDAIGIPDLLDQTFLPQAMGNLPVVGAAQEQDSQRAMQL